MSFGHMPRLSKGYTNNLVHVLTRGMLVFPRSWGTPSPKDEDQNRTTDIVKNTEVKEMDLGFSDSNSQDRLTALSAVRYRTPGERSD